jgi:hypothetical protein
MTKKKAAPKAKLKFKIIKRRDGRYAVKERCGGKVINGAEKQEFLLGQGLIKLSKQKASKE